MVSGGGVAESDDVPRLGYAVPGAWVDGQGVIPTSLLPDTCEGLCHSYRMNWFC